MLHMKNLSHIVFLGVIAAIFISVPVLTLMEDQSSISYYEQRRLTAFPTFSTTAIRDGTYFSDIDSFLSDRLCGRDSIAHSLNHAAQRGRDASEQRRA